MRQKILGIAALGILFFLLAKIESSVSLLPGVGKTPEERGATLILTGDVMIGRLVQTLSERNGEDYPFRLIREFLGSADITIGNLEGPIVAGAEKTPPYSFKFAFPPSAAKTLKDAGFSAFSLANNHTWDHGAEGYSSTREELSRENIAVFGHPVAISADSSASVRVGGQKFELLGFNATYKTFESSEALALIGEAKERGRALVFIHWGDEYATTSNAFQKELARAMIDAGAEAVIGSHPHVVEEIEIYKNHPIFYSLGNFVFDQNFSEDTKEGLVIRAEFKKDSTRYELFPVYIANSQPRTLEGGEREARLSLYGERSPGIKEEIASGSFTLNY